MPGGEGMEVDDRSWSVRSLEVERNAELCEVVHMAREKLLRWDIGG
jgi:hypothetical protein